MPFAGARRSRSRSPSKEDGPSKRPRVEAPGLTFRKSHDDIPRPFDGPIDGFSYPKRVYSPVEESIEEPPPPRSGFRPGRHRSRSRSKERGGVPALPRPTERVMRPRSASPGKPKARPSKMRLHSPAKGKGGDHRNGNGRKSPEIFVDWDFKGVPAATPFAGPYSPFSLAILPQAKPFPKHPGTDPLVTYSHLNCSYLSPHLAGSSASPTLLQLKRHCLSISNLIYGIQESDGSAQKHPPMDWVEFVGSGKAYENDDRDHNTQMRFVTNTIMDAWPSKDKKKDTHVALGGGSSADSDTSPNKDSPSKNGNWGRPESSFSPADKDGGWGEPERRFAEANISGSSISPESCPLASGLASHTSDYKIMLGHANDILEALDLRFAQYGGLLSLLAPPGHPQRNLIADTYVGQWMIYTANLSMRVAQLEVEVENSRNVLAGEATAPWVLGRSSFFGGGEGGEFGRELLFPQDRYVLSGLSQGLWERLDEKLLSEARRKNAVEGTMAAKVRGGRGKLGSAPSGDVRTIPGQPLELLVWIDIKSRVYRVQGKDTVFVVLGHGGELSPDTEYTTQLEKMPLISVLPYQVPGQDEARIRQEMEKEIRIEELLEEQRRLKREVVQQRSEIVELKGTKGESKGKGLGADKQEIFLQQAQLKHTEARVYFRDSKLAKAAKERTALEQALKDKTNSKDDTRIVDTLNENMQLQRELAAARSENAKLKKRQGEGEEAAEGRLQKPRAEGKEADEEAEMVEAAKVKPRGTRSSRGGGKKSK